METTQPKKGGNGLVIAFVLVLALGIGTAVIYTMRKKKSNAGDAGAGASSAAMLTTGTTAAPKPDMSTKGVISRATSVEDIGNNKLKATMSNGKIIILPKPTGVKFNAAPELLEKLKAKYGAGTLYQKGANLTDGFDYITNPNGTFGHVGTKIFIPMKLLFDIGKSPMQHNDTGDISFSSFYNN